MQTPLVTIVVPSFNQGEFLDDALTSIFKQSVPVEVFVMDGGSTDNSVQIIKKWENQLAGWRSRPDDGQSAAINEGMAQGSAPYVCWLNSDDWFLPNGLLKLIAELKKHPTVPAVYGRAWNVNHRSGKRYPVKVEHFNIRRMAVRCIISQPATLIRRSVWEAVGGVNEALHMSMDYDLWWKVFKQFGAMLFLNEDIAVNRQHVQTKTQSQRRLHYRESMAIVKKYNGHLPLKWWLAQPYAVWFKSIVR